MELKLPTNLHVNLGPRLLHSAKEEGNQQETRLSDFLLQFSNLRYSTITLQMEFSYNLVDGLDRFKSFPHIAMFRDVLSHNISERVLTRLVNKVFRLRSQLVMTLEKINSSDNYIFSQLPHFNKRKTLLLPL